MQNENPAFVSLIGYTGIIYAFFGDIFFFNVKFTMTELMCALCLIALTVSVIFMKLRTANIKQKQMAEEKEKIENEEPLETDKPIN